MRTNRIAITVRFSPEEKENTERNAAEVGCSVSRFLASTGSRNRQPVSREEREFSAKIIAALNRLGNNVNQLATEKNVAQFGAAAEPEAYVIEQAGLEILSLVAEIRERIKL